MRIGSLPSHSTCDISFNSTQIRGNARPSSRLGLFSSADYPTTGKSDLLEYPTSSTAEVIQADREFKPPYHPQLRKRRAIDTQMSLKAGILELACVAILLFRPDCREWVRLTRDRNTNTNLSEQG